MCTSALASKSILLGSLSWFFSLCSKKISYAWVLILQKKSVFFPLCFSFFSVKVVLEDVLRVLRRDHFCLVMWPQPMLSSLYFMLISLFFRGGNLHPLNTQCHKPPGNVCDRQKDCSYCKFCIQMLCFLLHNANK